MALRKKPTKIQFEPEIVAVRDGLYCRVNFTVRLAVHSLLSGRTSIVKSTHNHQLQRRTPFSDHQSYPMLYSNDNIVSLILAYRDSYLTCLKHETKLLSVNKSLETISEADLSVNA